MPLRNNNPATPDVRELQLTVNQLQQDAYAFANQIASTNRYVNSLLYTRASTPPAPVGNLLWNGEVGHSVNSWNDTSYVTTDKAKEAVWWYSHGRPQDPHDFLAADVNVGTDTFHIPAHGFSQGQSVDFRLNPGPLPVPLSTVVPYFIIYVDADNFKVATTYANAVAGTAVNITTANDGRIEERLISTNAITSSINNTLKETSHSTYTPVYSRWNSQNGWAELTGTSTVDQILPTNFIDATTTLARISMICAKKNQYIELPADCLMGAGIWDNTLGQAIFLTGDIGLTAEVVGTPAVGVERRYRALFTSDQGYQLLSPEITLAVAPKDSEFSPSVYVALGWRQQVGQLEVQLFEYLPSGGNGGGAPEYRLIQTISAATSYIHYGAYLSIVAGYPTTQTGTVRTATFFTNTGEMSVIATNGVSPNWDTLNFPCGVPNNYNKSNTTGNQWLRVWLTVAPNLFVEGCTTNGTTTITAPASVFDAEYDTLFDAGNLVAEVYDVNDVLLATTTVASRTDDTHLVLGTSIAAGSNRKLRIVGGGFHGVYIDKVNLGFQLNTSYTPNAFDTRTLQPVAAPTSSTQGGTGSGGTGGGINYCVTLDTPIKQDDETRKPIGECIEGELWDSAAMNPNMLLKLRPGFEFTRRVEAENGVWIECTDTERFTATRNDLDGISLFSLRVGDKVMTEIDGKYAPSKLKYIGALSTEKKRVMTPSLSNTHYFMAGQLKETWGAWLKRCVMRGRKRQGSFVLHNAKPNSNPDPPLP